MTAQPILPGTASGPVLRLDQPLSFWGGVDPATGTLLVPPHAAIAGTVLAEYELERRPTVWERLRAPEV